MNQKEKEFKDTTSFGIYGFPTLKSTEDVENNQFFLMLDYNGFEPNFNNMTKNWFVVYGMNEDAYRNKLISVTKENIFYLVADVDKFIQNNISLVSKCDITNYFRLLLFAMKYLEGDKNYSITKLFYWQKLKEYLPTLTKKNKIILVYEYIKEINKKNATVEAEWNKLRDEYFTKYPEMKEQWDLKNMQQLKC